MPTYEYVCDGCRAKMEIRHSITDPPRVICPKCDLPRLRRLISRTLFVLKGSGWAKDGYGSGR